MDDLFQKSEVLYWAPSVKTRNFGDFISDLFLESMLVAPRVRASRYRLIGSIVDNENIARDLDGIKDGGNIAYWGCGARDDQRIRPELLERCEFFGARGPLTRDLLGLPSDTVLGDPGLLLPLIRPPVAAKGRHGKTVCVPHIFEPKSDEALVAVTGAERVIRAEIAPNLKALGQLIDQITGAEFVLAGAMHAAVIAHAYGVPFAFFDTGYLDIPFKWRDFAASIGIPVMFVDNVQDGRTAYEDLIRNRAKRLPLLPLLAACPYYVQPSILVKAAAFDANLKTDARLISTLKSAGFEAKAYAEASIKSERARDARLKTRFEQQAQALGELQAASAAAQEALSALERDSRAAQEALAAREVELLEADRRRLEAEKDCGRWMADSEHLFGELRSLRKASAGLSRELELSRKAAAEFEAALEEERERFAASEGRLEAAEARVRTLRGEADRLETRLEELSRRSDELEAEKAALAQALDDAGRRMRDLRFENRLKDPALPRGGAGPFAPLGLELRLAFARLAARRRDWGAAERQYGKILLRNPEHPRVLVQYGHALKEQGELELAASAYARAFRLPGADFDVVEHLAFALRETGRGEAAEAVEHEASRGGDVLISPGHTPTRRPAARLTAPLSPLVRLAAIRAAKAGDWARAARKYEALVRTAPGHATYWVLYGHALKEAGDSRRALAAYAMALRLDPKRADTHLQLGHALKLLERRVDAERAYEHAFQLAPSDIRARRELEWMGRTQAELIHLTLESGEAHWLRPARMLGGGVLDLAMAKLAAKKTDWPQAARRYRSLLARTPGDWRSWVQLGHALKEQGRLVEAEGAYLHALALEPGDADIHLQLGHLLKLRGFRKEAADAYERASRLDPGMEEARRELEAIRAELRWTAPPADRAADRNEPGRASSTGAQDTELRTRLGLSAREARILRELKAALNTELDA